MNRGPVLFAGLHGASGPSPSPAPSSGCHAATASHTGARTTPHADEAGTSRDPVHSAALTPTGSPHIDNNATALPAHGSAGASMCPTGRSLGSADDDVSIHGQVQFKGIIAADQLQEQPPSTTSQAAATPRIGKRRAHIKREALEVTVQPAVATLRYLTDTRAAASIKKEACEREGVAGGMKTRATAQSRTHQATITCDIQ